MTVYIILLCVCIAILAQRIYTLEKKADFNRSIIDDTRECLEILSDTVEFVIHEDMQDDEIDWYYTEPMSDKEWEEIKKMMLKGWKK